MLLSLLIMIMCRLHLRMLSGFLRLLELFLYFVFWKG